MNTQSHAPSPRNTERLLLAVILLAAVWLRWEYLVQIEHNTDHAWPVAQALETLEHGALPLVGQGTSVLFASPPLTGYLYLPFVAVTRSPLGAYLLVIGLNTLAVLLAYRAVRGLLGWRAGLIAAALLAANPWVVEYSRTSWVQSLVPFFAAAAAWLLWPVLLGQSTRPVRRTALALVMVTMLSQTYLLGFALLAPVGLLLVIFRRRVPRRGLLIGGAVFAVAAGLYGVGLLGQWETVQARLDSFASGPARLSTEAWSHAVRLVTGEGYSLARGMQAPIQDAARRAALGEIAHVGVLIALLAGLALAVWALLRRSDRRDTAIIALVWFGLPVAMMSYVSQVVHPFYLLIGLPAGYALAAWGAEAALLRPRWRRPGALITAALLIAFTTLRGIDSARYYQETAAIPGAHGLSALSLEYGLQVGAAVRAAMPDGGVAYYAEQEGWVLESFTGRTLDVVHDTRAPAFYVVPAAGGVYVDARPPAPEPQPTSLRGSTRTAAFNLPDGWTILVEAFPPGAADSCADGLTPLDIPSEEGLTLTAYDLDDSDDVWQLTTAWTVSTRGAETDSWLFAPFAHVFNAAGERVLIADGEAVPGYEWRTGDCHLHTLTFTPPESGGPFRVEVGQYDAIRADNLIFVRGEEYTPTVGLVSAAEGSLQ